MTPESLLRRIASGDGPAVVDVRSGWEYARGHVPGAQHVPFWRYFLPRAPLPPAGGEPVVVYCGHGPRARIAAVLLRARGVPASRLSGHMAGWRRAGGPEERARPTSVPPV